MRIFIGIVIALLGAGVMLYGIGNALSELAGLYQGVIDNPLGQTDNVEKTVSKDMIRMAFIGACGIPVFLLGMLIYLPARAKNRRARRAARRR